MKAQRGSRGTALLFLEPWHISNKTTTNIVTFDKLFSWYKRMLVPGHPRCPWGCRDHVTTFFVAQTGAGILICKRGYFFARHTVHTYMWWRFSFYNGYETFICSCNFQLETVVMQMDTDLPRRPLIPCRRFCGYVGLSLWIPHCQRSEKIVQDVAIVLFATRHI
jgi:hypothetical protein